MLDGGVGRGRRFLAADWAGAATAPRRDFNGMQYGYLWWSTEYPYRGRKVRAFFAAGNGGQISMAVPELDLAVAFLSGNYGDRAGLTPQRVYVPEYILPAVR